MGASAEPGVAMGRCMTANTDPITLALTGQLPAILIVATLLALPT